MEESSFDVLEEKVRKAADLVRRLRKENKALEEDLGKAKLRLQEAERRLAGLDKERGAGAEAAKELDALTRETKILRQERAEIRSRIAKLVEVLQALD